jgi:hypothetical protein
VSLFLVQVGKSTWVDPDTIQAIEWNQMSDCPTLLLGGQQRVNAYNFKHMASAATPNDAEAGTNALLAWLQKAVITRDALERAP